MKKLVIFDFDGTIADSKKLYVEIIRTSLLKALFLYPKSRIVKALGPKLNATLQNLNIAPKLRKKLSKEINSWITEKAASLKVCPYAAQTLKKLKLRKQKMWHKTLMLDWLPIIAT